MKSEKRTVFRCEYCGRGFLVAPTCQHHELVCAKNQKNKHACWGCVHLLKEQVLIDCPYDLRDNSPESIKVGTFRCWVSKKYLYSNKAVVNRHWLTKVESYNLQGKELNHELMPYECECRNSSGGTL